MLTIKQLEEKAKLENLKIRLDSLNRDLLLKTINQKTYNKEKALISQELYDIEHSKGINALDEMFDYPLEQIDKLIEEGRNIFQ